MSNPFRIIEPKGRKVPIILSIPHCGTEFPPEIIDDFDQKMASAPDDTDWYVQDLYNFVPEIGVTIIHARYSRWVIDLNRDPESTPLYDDGRIITGLTPSTDFFGRDIYTSEGKIPDQNEVDRRLKAYYWPYYQKVQSLLDKCRSEFGKSLLWDAHSIRHRVPTIQKEIFPDMILGDNDKKTAHPALIEAALLALNAGRYQVSHNTPFKGGHITRYFGKPHEDQHALQLEMTKILYMDDSETLLNKSRANKLRKILKNAFEQLIGTLNHF